MAYVVHARALQRLWFSLRGCCGQRFVALLPHIIHESRIMVYCTARNTLILKTLSTRLVAAVLFRINYILIFVRREAFALQSGLWGALKSKLLLCRIQDLYTHSSRTLVKSLTIKLHSTCTGVSGARPGECSLSIA